MCFFVFYGYGDHRDLHVLTHSFPTRRSADLGQGDRVGRDRPGRRRGVDAVVSAVLSEQPQAEILLDVPAEEYHRKVLGTVSAGVLRRLNEQTPAHYRAWVDDAEDDEPPATVFGRAYHDRVLLHDLFARRYVGEPLGPPLRPTDAMRNAKNPSDPHISRV